MPPKFCIAEKPFDLLSKFNFKMNLRGSLWFQRSLADFCVKISSHHVLREFLPLVFVMKFIREWNTLQARLVRFHFWSLYYVRDFIQFLRRYLQQSEIPWYLSTWKKLLHSLLKFSPSHGNVPDNILNRNEIQLWC